MIGSYQLNDQAVASQAQLASIASYCGLQGNISKDVVYSFEQASEQVYSVSVYNKDLQAQVYRDTQERFKELTPQQQQGVCGEVVSRLSVMTEQLENLHSNITQLRFTEINVMSQSIAAFGNSINQNAPRPVPYTYTPPQTQGFTPQSNDTDHYLIHTDQGNKLCAVTPSGYVNCN